ncbi:MAG: hypothetical protein RMK29_19705, partial [Myxococcales bacterium]|nr:hypothetical protein [Myxococcales bacterium]
MFDDDAEDIGQEIDAYCPRCKTDMTHVVVSRYEDEIRRVKCNTCEDVHAFRRPRGEDVAEELVEAPVKKKAQKARPTWEQVMARKRKEPRPYHGNEVFQELDIIDHPTFGIGFVSELIGQDKIEVTFQNDKRILVHNRQGLNLNLVQRQHLEGGEGSRAGASAEKERARRPLSFPSPEEDLPDLGDELPTDLPDVPDVDVEDFGPAPRRAKPSKLSTKALSDLDDEEAEEMEPEETEEMEAEETEAAEEPQTEAEEATAEETEEATEQPTGRRERTKAGGTQRTPARADKAPTAGKKRPDKTKAKQPARARSPRAAGTRTTGGKAAASSTSRTRSSTRSTSKAKATRSTSKAKA